MKVIFQTINSYIKNIIINFQFFFDYIAINIIILIKNFNNITDTRAKIPLWIKPAFYKKGLRSDSRLIFSLDLPTTVLGAFKLKKESLPGLDILDLNMKKDIFNKRSKMMILYGQYNKEFQPFSYLIKDKENWTIINSEKAKKIAKNKFFIDQLVQNQLKVSYIKPASRIALFCLADNTFSSKSPTKS